MEDSKLNIDHRSCLDNSVLKCFHKRKVNAASCSAYGPTYIGGSSESPDFESTFHASAASFNNSSFLLSCK